MEGMQLARRKFDSDNAGSLAIGNEKIQNLKFIKERDPILQTLLVQGLQDHVTCAIRGMRGTANGFARFIIGVPAERSL
jgi:hypothetical protein